MFGIRVFKKLFMIKTSGLVVEFLDAGNFSSFAVGLGIVGFFGDGDTGAISQFFDGIDEGEVLILHQEGEGIAALAAAIAFVSLRS